MSKQDFSFKRMFKELKDQEYFLKKLNDNEIHIKGIPTITPFMFFILILIGVILIIIGILSVTLKEPEWISGSLFMAAGLFLILLPFQNYYSKKALDISIRKDRKSIEIKSFFVTSKKLKISFDDIDKIIIKKTKTNTFVDDTSESSTIQNYIIELGLANREEETLLRFFRKDKNSEIFTNDFTDFLSEFLKKEKTSVVVE